MKLENVQLYVATPDEDEHYKFMGNLSSVETISLSGDEPTEEASDDVIKSFTNERSFTGTINASSNIIPTILAVSYDIVVGSYNTLVEIAAGLIKQYNWKPEYLVRYAAFTTGLLKDGEACFINDAETKKEFFTVNREFKTLDKYLIKGDKNMEEKKCKDCRFSFCADQDTDSYGCCVNNKIDTEVCDNEVNCYEDK